MKYSLLMIFLIMSFMFLDIYFFAHLVFSFTHDLVRMSRDYQYDDGAQQCGQGNGQNLRLDQIKIKHEGYTWWNEEKTKISDEEIS